jgi:hypothetical protein
MVDAMSRGGKLTLAKAAVDVYHCGSTRAATARGSRVAISSRNATTGKGQSAGMGFPVEVRMSAGLITIAYGPHKYMRMAEALALSYRRYHPKLPLCVVTDEANAERLAV